jgi:hypothetical protein
MKKKLGILVLTLSSIVISAACASSGDSSRPNTPEAGSGEVWTQSRPSVLRSQATIETAAAESEHDGRIGVSQSNAR